MIRLFCVAWRERGVLRITMNRRRKIVIWRRSEQRLYTLIERVRNATEIREMNFYLFAKRL